MRIMSTATRMTDTGMTINNAQRQTEKIRLWGIVQGVGFRPFVSKIAHRMHMNGEVLNIGGLVEITVTDTENRITAFLRAIEEEKPEPAEIVHVKRIPLPYREFHGFSILDSGYGDDEAAMIPADLAICPNCLAEMRDPENPRYKHPFISCMVCGPRYTIIDRIPYDRENTTMIDFPMCDFCEKEYTGLEDRRYHAQTISCHDCGPVLSSDLKEAAQLLRDGQVIAFRSMGGYNLIADIKNDQAVHRLRQIKNREEKPFAVMFRSVEEVRTYCHMNEVEEKLLVSSARPIILLEHRESLYAEINRSRFIGAFLPSMGAQYLLLDEISPLIVTSANRSDQPIIKDEEEMLRFAEEQPLITRIISNERRIQVRVDDSVVRVIDGQPQMIRRSKGYAPVPLYVPAGENRTGGSDKSRIQIFAAGGQLKNSFALSKGPFAYMSQYFGDLDSVENQRIYEETVVRMAELFRIKPQKAVCDLHPLYQTTAFSRRYAMERGIPLIGVQHHHAHVASVMAEHDLQGDVIGVSFDGTGYGTDGKIWGGEFFLCRGGAFQREAHLKYVKMPGGDSSMRESWKSAVSYLYAFENGYLEQTETGDVQCAGEESSEGRALTVDLSDIIAFSQDRVWNGEMTVRKALEMGINTIESSSMGRLFDGVSALLGIKERNDYEGQCAVLLEDAAAAALKNPGVDRRADLALNFHYRIADLISDTCIAIRNKTGASQVALTGGVFQNRILMEESLARLRRNGFLPYYNISVSPNDGGIALGQLFIALKGGGVSLSE